MLSYKIAMLDIPFVVSVAGLGSILRGIVPVVCLMVITETVIAEECPYHSIQTRVQKDITQPWDTSLVICPGEQVHVGTMKNGEDQFTDCCTNLYLTGPGYQATVANNSYVTLPDEGTYILTARCGTVDGDTTTIIVRKPLPQYDRYFDEAATTYSIPSNLLRALAWVVSKWKHDTVSNTGDCGCMQLAVDNRQAIAEQLGNDWPEAYGAMGMEELQQLLCSESEEGLKANIRGGAYWLASRSESSPVRLSPELRVALESWWFAVAAYQGFPFSDRRISNFPYFVYNCFIDPVKYGCKDKVPKIPITLPPHVTFLKVPDDPAPNNKHDPFDTQLRPDDDICKADSLIPTSPPSERDGSGNIIAGFVRVTEFFNACNDMGIVHDDAGIRMPTGSFSSCNQTSGVQSLPFRLLFPLDGTTSRTSPISSIFDYTISNLDNYVMAYTGEFGNRVSTESGACGNYDFRAYRNPVKNTVFRINDQYNDQCLYYDGHTGYDFPGTTINATAAGTFHTTDDKLNTGYIDHGNGYRTYYLHTATYHIDDGAIVYAGEVVGEVGMTGTDIPHLHVEIRKNFDPENNPDAWNVVDPYGWHGDPEFNEKNERIWTRAANSTLWNDTGRGGIPLGNQYKNADRKKHGGIARIWIQCCNDVWSINTKKGIRIVFIDIFDQQGRCAYRSSGMATTNECTIPPLADGLFLIRVRLNDGRSVTKVFFTMR